MSLVATKMLDQLSGEFCRLLGNGRYFEAHEALEKIWFDLRFSKDQEVRLIRAFINAAVSFELVRRQRKEAAARPWLFYTKHQPLIKNMPAEHHPFYLKIEAKILDTFARLGQDLC